MLLEPNWVLVGNCPAQVDVARIWASQISDWRLARGKAGGGSMTSGREVDRKKHRLAMGNLRRTVYDDGAR